MAYFVCAGEKCDVEMRQSDSHYCDSCWREGMGKTPRVEWMKVSEKAAEGIQPSKSCDYCHRRSVKWVAHSTVCNNCYFKENSNFKEDVTSTLSFLRDLNPPPLSKEFKGDVTLVVPRRDVSPALDDDSHRDHSHEQHYPENHHSDGDGSHIRETTGNHHETHYEVSGNDHERHRDRPWAELSAKRQPVRIQAHRYILASKSSVFRKMFEDEARQVKEEARQAKEADMTERLRLMRETSEDDDHTTEKKRKHHRKRHDEEHEEREQHDRKAVPRETGVFLLEGVGSSVLQAAVNFMYTAEIQFTERVQALDVLRFAHEYDVPWLKKVCESEIAKTISETNLSEILRLSYRWEAHFLKKAARRYFEEHPELHNEVLDALLAPGS